MGARIGLWLAALGAVLCLLLLISGISVSADDLIVVTSVGLLVCIALVLWFVRLLRAR